MAKAVHAVDYLAQPDKHRPKPVCVAFGDEAFLRRQVLLKLREAVLGGDEGDFSLTTFEGRDAEFRDVREELATVAMFGGGQRLVIVDEADEFVTRDREQLEAYVAQPSRSGVLVLDIKSFPSNTRLYKAVDSSGLAVDCNAPPTARLARWLTDWAKQAHQTQLSVHAAELLIEIIGPELGLLDQELAKLALVVGASNKITEETIGRMVGGWRAKTTWEMLDAALDGKVAEAVQQLDRLLASGEQPLGVLAQISATLRRFAAATRLVIQSEKAGKRVVLGQVLQQAGVKPFVVQKAERQLKRLGRQRGKQIYGWLLEADLDLKGDSAMPPRLILERLIIRLAAPADPVPARR